MSTDKSAESIKNPTASNTEGDKTQSTATDEASHVTATVGVEERDDKKGNKTFGVNNSSIVLQISRARSRLKAFSESLR